jgi:hypothetical protein
MRASSQWWWRNLNLIIAAVMVFCLAAGALAGCLAQADLIVCGAMLLLLAVTEFLGAAVWKFTDFSP